MVHIVELRIFDVVNRDTFNLNYNNMDHALTFTTEQLLTMRNALIEVRVLKERQLSTLKSNNSETYVNLVKELDAAKDLVTIVNNILFPTKTA